MSWLTNPVIVSAMFLFIGQERLHAFGNKIVYKSFTSQPHSKRWHVKVFQSDGQYCFKFKRRIKPDYDTIHKKVVAYWMKENQLEFRSFLTQAILGLSAPKKYTIPF